MKNLRSLLIILFFIGGSTMLFSENCNSDADCARQCYCEGYMTGGNCKPGGDECCVCQQGEGDE